MFTGLIQTIGTVTEATRHGDDLRLRVAMDAGALPLALGASIACDGICLTVTTHDAASFTADLSHETLACTNARHWQVGTRINLEASLRVGDALGGHFVSGHVDAVAAVCSVTPHGDATDITIALPAAIAPYVAAKGSIAINGISLTVNRVSADDFALTIIPHTMQHTTLRDVAVGSLVNLEIDMLARYAVRALEMRA